MAKSLKEFINDLVAKAGIKTDDADFVSFIANPDLEKFTIPDTMSQTVERALISIKDATNNHSTIKQHYFKAAYDGLDKTINEVMNELELSDDIKSEILAEKSSTQRAALLARKLKSLEKSANKSGDVVEAEKYRTEINNLNKKVADKETAISKLKEKHAAEIKSIQKNSKLEKTLSSYQTIHDKLDPDIRETVLMAMINKKLQAENGKIEVDENGNLILQKSDGTNFHGENNMLMNVNTFIEKVLADNGALAQNRGGGQQNNNGQRDNSFRQQNSSLLGNDHGQQNNGQSNGDNGSKFSQRTTSLVEKAIEDLEKASQKPSII